MESLGEYLRRQRESKGLSLREISDMTKIGINYLRYIEENNFDKIPGEVFLKGFLRLYARSVGLREEEIMERYLTLYKEKDKEDIDQKVIKVRHRRFPFRLSLRAKPSWLWVIPILLFAILLFKEITKKNVQPLLPSTEVKTLTQPMSPPVLSQDIPQKLTLSIEAIEETWLKIIIDDGKEVKDILLNSGDKVSFDAEKNFGLTVGNAGGIKVNFNGKELEPLGPSGMVIRNLVLSREEKSSSPAISTPSPLPFPQR
jgi:cytoskeletal protein RodZ